MTKDGKYAYICFDGSETAFKIRLEDFKVEESADLSVYFPLESEQIVIDASEKKLFIYSPSWQKFLVLGTQTMRVIHTIDVIAAGRLTKSRFGPEIIVCNGGGTVKFINTETYEVTEFNDDKMLFNMIQECKDDQNKWYVVSGRPGEFYTGIYDRKTNAWVNKIAIPVQNDKEYFSDLKVLSEGNKAYIATFGGWYPDFHAYGWLYSADLASGKVKASPIDGGASCLEENPGKHQLYIGTCWPKPSVNNILVYDTMNDKILRPILLQQTKYNWYQTQTNDMVIDPANPDILYTTNSDGNAFDKIDLNSLKVSDMIVLNEESMKPCLFIRQPARNTVFVLIHQSAKAFELDIDKAAINDTIRFPSIRSDAYAYDAAFIENGKEMLIARGESFLEVDTATMRLVARHPLPPKTPSVWHFILSNDQKTIYTVTNDGNDYADTFMAIDAADFKIKARLKLEGGGFFSRPYELPGSSKLYILGGQTNGAITIHVVDKKKFSIQKTITFDQPDLQGISAENNYPYAFDAKTNALFLATYRAVLALDTSKDMIKDVIHLEDTARAIGFEPSQFEYTGAVGLVFNPEENYLYIAHLDRSYISIYDLVKHQFLPQVIPLQGCFPHDVFANDDCSRIYSVNIRSDSITVINTSLKKVEKVINLHEYR